MLRTLAISALFAAAVGVTAAMPAQAATYATYGDAFNNGTAFDLTSYGSSGVGYSGLEMQPSGTLTLGAITQLSSDYNMISGSFGGGAPRFTLFDQNLNAVYAYWGTPLGGGSFANPVPNGTPSNTGNYADLLSTDVRFYSNGFGGLNSPNSGLTWAQLVAAVGSTDVTWVTLDLDGGFTGDQHLLVNNFAVNGDVFSAAPSTTPLPAALPMFATGMAGLGLLRWRRKNKSAAKAA